MKKAEKIVLGCIIISLVAAISLEIKEAVNESQWYRQSELQHHVNGDCFIRINDSIRIEFENSYSGDFYALMVNNKEFSRAYITIYSHYSNPDKEIINRFQWRYKESDKVVNPLKSHQHKMLIYKDCN